MATSDIYQSTFDEDVPTTTSATQQTCPECEERVQTNVREMACTECRLALTNLVSPRRESQHRLRIESNVNGLYEVLRLYIRVYRP